MNSPLGILGLSAMIALTFAEAAENPNVLSILEDLNDQLEPVSP